MITKTMIMADILKVVIEANATTGRRLYFRYDALTNMEYIEVTIAESKVLFNDWLYTIKISTQRSTLAQLDEFKHILSQLIRSAEIDTQAINNAYWNKLEGTYVDDHRHKVMV